MLLIWTSLTCCHLVKSELFTKRENFRLVNFTAFTENKSFWLQSWQLTPKKIENIVVKRENAAI